MNIKEIAKNLGIDQKSWVYRSMVTSYYNMDRLYASIEDPELGLIIMDRQISGGWSITRIPRLSITPVSKN